MKNLILHSFIVSQLLLTTIFAPYSYAAETKAEPVDPEIIQQMAELKAYCDDVGANPLSYEKNARDKSVQSWPVEVKKGVIKHDTLIKLDHDGGPSYLSCFQHFNTPLQAKSLDERIVDEEKFQAKCREDAKKGKTPVVDLKNQLQNITNKMTCEESEQTSVASCANDIAYCGLEHMNVAKALKVQKPKGLNCSSLGDAALKGVAGVGECAATFIRGAFDEILMTLNLLVVEAPKWVYNNTIGKFFQEPAVKQLENVGTVEAMAATKASNADIKKEKAEPEKTLTQKIVNFTKELIVDSAAKSYGCEAWSTGVPGVGTCVKPAGNWECASCKQKAMAVCGAAGFATGMIAEVAVLAVPVGIVGGTAAALGAGTKIVKAGQAIKAATKGSEVLNAASKVGSAALKVGDKALKVLKPIAATGFKIGKKLIANLRLIPGVEITAKTLAKPIKLFFTAGDKTTSKMWSYSYHGSRAYTETLVKTGNPALVMKAAQAAAQLNLATKAANAVVKSNAELAKVNEKAAEPLSAAEAKKVAADKKVAEKKLAEDTKIYLSAQEGITAKEVEALATLKSDHAVTLAADYGKSINKIDSGTNPVYSNVINKAVDALEEERAAAKLAEEQAAVAGPKIKMSEKQIKADELAKLIAVDEETQKLISEPVIAQYLYLNHFASDAEKVELKIALQDIANSTKVGDTDIFHLVNEKLAAKLNDPAIQKKVAETFETGDEALRPGKLDKATYELRVRAKIITSMPETTARLKKLIDEGFSVEVMDEGLFHFYGATQLGLKESQMRPWEKIPGGFSAIRPNQVENISPDLWARMAAFASETEAPIHGYSTNSGDALRGLIPSISRFMGKNEEEYLAFEAKSAKAIEDGTAHEVGPFCTNVWCGEEKRHENAVGRFSEQVTGQKAKDAKTYEADKRGDYLDADYALKHLAGRNSSEWNANSIYFYMRAHSKDGANKWVDQVRQDETKHMAIFATGYKYFFGNQTGKRTKEMLDKIMDLKKQASTSNSSGDVLSENAAAMAEVGITHLFVENKVRQFTRTVPLKTMEKIFDSPVKTLEDLESVPLTAEKKKAIEEMNVVERKKREDLARWTPEEREKFLALKKVEKEQGPLIEGLITNLFNNFKGAEVYGSKEAEAVLKQINKLRTGLDPKTNALIQLSLQETLRDYQIMNNKFVRSKPELKVRFKNAQEGFVVEHKAPGEATVQLAQSVTDNTFLLRVDRPKDLELTPGAAVRVEVDTPSGKDFRVLSLASAPQKDKIEFAVGVSDSEFKQSLMKLKPGQSVSLSKAKGSMNFDPTKPTVMIAGGIGITPFRSMIQHVKDNKLDTPMHLYYSNKSQIPFGDEFVKAAEEGDNLSLTTILSQPNKDWKGPKGRIDDKFLAAEVPKLPGDAKYYIVGPPAMVTGTKDNLIKLGVKPEDIQIEIFAIEKPAEEASRSTAAAGPATPAAPKEKAVCRCFSVGKEQIVRVIKQGNNTMEMIAEATGATRGCGGCSCDIEKILQCEIGR